MAARSASLASERACHDVINEGMDEGEDEEMRM
jgi:hypothetical protein